MTAAVPPLRLPLMEKLVGFAQKNSALPEGFSFSMHEEGEEVGVEFR